jgi:hypothetical protein
MVALAGRRLKALRPAVRPNSGPRAYRSWRFPEGRLVFMCFDVLLDGQCLLDDPYAADAKCSRSFASRRTAG